MRKNYFLLTLFLSLSVCANAQWLWNANKLQEIKKNLNSLTYANAYRTLIQDAENAIQQGTYSVTYKEGLAPSGNKHDYVSLSRYVWADLSKSDGLPYIHKDGQSNPELEKYDRNPLGKMASAVTTLSLAYYYSNDERYAKKAVELLRVWFLNKDTKMNPHLTYAQFVPGVNDNKGRPFGLIDTYSFVDMLNGVKLLEQSKSYTQKDKTELVKWFTTFTKWWQSSDQGKAEKKGLNNHGLAYDVQLVSFSLFTGDTKTAKKIINEFPKERIFTQIEPDGKQPQELRRTLAFHYSQYNIHHMIDMFTIAQNLGIDIHKAESEDGRSFYKAVDFLTPYLGKNVEDWPYQQISGWENKQQDLCDDLYRITLIDPSRQDYLELYNTYSKQDISQRNRLMYGATDVIASTFEFANKQFHHAFTCMEEVLSSTQRKDLVNPRSINKDGSLRIVNPRDWCSGFFPGSMWFMYNYTNRVEWKEKADRQTMLIKEEQFDSTSHDLGFKLFNSFGNGYKFTKNQEYRDVVIQGAKTLSKRFDEKIGSIRSWDWNKHVWQFPVIIDNMMNLELLFEASKYTGDDSLYNIADKHAQTTMKNHFRPDFSSFHVVDYDTISGKAIKRQTFQGYSDPSAWARGQAWALYGYAMTYRYTKKTEYLSQSEGIANFIFTHPNLPKDLIPYWDFNDPTIPNAPRDASAACVIASALYELSEYSETNKEKYIAWADKILENLIKSYMPEVDTHKGFLLLHSTGHLPGGDEIDVPISYADYYFLEALTRRKDLFKNK